MMIIQFLDKGNSRSIFSNDFNNILWKDNKNLGYFHKDFHSENTLHTDVDAYISDFGLSGPENERKSDDKICRVFLEVLNCSFGKVMAELLLPFHKRKRDASLALAICNGSRLKFGKETCEIYKKLTYEYMNANSIEIVNFWYDSIDDNDNNHDRNDDDDDDDYNNIDDYNYNDES